MAASIPEQIITAVLADALITSYVSPNGNTVQSATGEREREKNAGPPRIVAVPRGAPGELRMPDRPGDARYTDKGRILLLRDFEIFWQCHDVDFGSAEALYLATLAAIRKQNHNSVIFRDEEWRDQREGEDGYDKFGTVISFTSTIAIPIYENRASMVQLTATPKIVTTVQLPDDGSGETVTINEG